MFSSVVSPSGEFAQAHLVESGIERGGGVESFRWGRQRRRSGRDFSRRRRMMFKRGEMSYRSTPGRGKGPLLHSCHRSRRRALHFGRGKREEVASKARVEGSTASKRNESGDRNRRVRGGLGKGDLRKKKYACTSLGNFPLCTKGDLPYCFNGCFRKGRAEKKSTAIYEISRTSPLQGRTGDPDKRFMPQRRN